MTHSEVALQILCAVMSHQNYKIDLYPELGEKQIRTCFEIAKTFLMVSKEVDPVRTPDPNVIAPRNK